MMVPCWISVCVCVCVCRTTPMPHQCRRPRDRFECLSVLLHTGAATAEPQSSTRIIQTPPANSTPAPTSLVLKLTKQ